MTLDTHERRLVLYRSRHGKIFGVCRGLAESLDLSVFWTRVLVVIATMMTGFWPGVFCYGVAALVLKPESPRPLESPEEQEFYYAYTGSRLMALQRLKRTFDGLDRRVQRMESIVTARDFDWEQRMNG